MVNKGQKQELLNEFLSGAYRNRVLALTQGSEEVEALLISYNEKASSKLRAIVDTRREVISKVSKEEISTYIDFCLNQTSESRENEVVKMIGRGGLERIIRDFVPLENVPEILGQLKTIVVEGFNNDKELVVDRIIKFLQCGKVFGLTEILKQLKKYSEEGVPDVPFYETEERYL